jgi:hypothetical protein
MSIRQDALVAPIEQLESALRAPAPGREHDWAHEVEGILGRVEEALRRHVADTDAAGGMFTEVDLTRPTLVRQVSALRQEHTSFLERTGELRRDVSSAAQAFQPHAPDGGADRLPAPAAPAGVPDFGALRQQLEKFAAALKHHRDEEAGLVIESVATDIGVGD